MEDMARGVAGTVLFRAWAGRKALAETARPEMVSALAALAALAGGLFVAQGVLVGWFLKQITPATWFEEILYRQLDVGSPPGMELASWLAGAAMIMIGAAVLLAAASLPRKSKPGTYFIIAAIVGLLVTGGVFLYAGIRFHAGWFIAFGCANLGLMLVLSIALGLSWYTLDPLGLHAEPS